MRLRDLELRLNAGNGNDEAKGGEPRNQRYSLNVHFAQARGMLPCRRINVLTKRLKKLTLASAFEK